MSRTDVRRAAKIASTYVRSAAFEFNDTETGFIAKILEIDNDYRFCKLQPLRKYYDSDGNENDYAIIEDVPISDQAAWRAKPYIAPDLFDEPCGLGEVNEIKYPDEQGGRDPDVNHWQQPGHTYWERIKEGDIAICLCCTRSIDEAIEGEKEIDKGKSSINNAVVIGTFAFLDREPAGG